ncbi:MAG: MFS transporter [Chitinophagales bacterium]|nr:MFS transporter [Chitinophagales bacterium]
MARSAGRHPKELHAHWLNLAVIIAALGYFVDIYDLLLFGIVRVPSLQELGYSGDDLLKKGAFLLNWQMSGMLVGGILWGIWGDRKGRLSVLFGSIFLYSLANILNGTVHNIELYALYRFIAGVGLAGELGAGITLVSEVMTKEQRGYGTTIVAAFGIFGAVVGGLVAKLFDWRVAYYVGGGLGIALLILRISAYESGMFHQSKKEGVKRGDFFSLFTNRKRFSKYFKCILLGIPIWYVIGITITFGPEFATHLGIGIDPATGKSTVTGGNTIMYHYAGAATGALLCGLLSQWLKKRRQALLYFIIADAVMAVVYVSMHGVSVVMFYFIAFLFGITNGYWSVFITVASEQFGTNIRATVTTTTPNFVRGAVVPMTTIFVMLNAYTGSIITSALAVGAVVFLVAIIATIRTEETFGKDLDYIEEIEPSA